jgi:ferric-dicitrate binding protein FerR (iron transport regulator)
MKYHKKDIDNFFAGKFSQKEAKDFLNWLNSSEGEQAYNLIIDQEWQATDSGNEGGDNFLATKPANFKKNKNAKKFLSLKSNIWLGLAASILMIFSVSFILYFYPNSDVVEIPQSIAEVNTIIKSTPKGVKKTIKLPDGSMVALNSDSKLTYKEDFLQNRIVNLEGEGFFEVVKDEQHPFSVITDNISTTALGTSFNIKAYAGKPEIQVVLASGKVKVENKLDNSFHEILPGEATHYSTVNQTLKKGIVDVAAILKWKDGILHFDKVPFNIIIEDLERWYGIDFQVIGTDKLPEYKCSGTFKPNEYLSNVLTALSYSVEFDYTIENENVILKFN